MKNCKTLTILITAFLIGCDSAEPDTWEPTVLAATPLETINYDAIGSGKIVFKRSGRNGGAGGVYVIDAVTKRSWGFRDVPNVDPAVSPDGDEIAFSRWANRETAYDVFVVDIQGHNPRNVAKTPGQARAPSWTPDGRHVVYHSGVPYKIWVGTTRVQVDRVLVDGHLIPHDYRRISASSTLDLLIPAGLAFPQPPSCCRGIYRLRPGSSSPELWITPSDRHVSDIVAAWSPDDEQIAYLEVKTSQARLELWIMDEDRGNRRMITEVGMTSGIDGFRFSNNLSIAWSPDGTRIAFSLPSAHAPSHIYIATVDGSSLWQLTTADDVIDESVSWSL